MTGSSDLGATPGADLAVAGSSSTPYFDPDIQKDLDTLGCTASACHGSSASPLITAAPSTPADWMSNFTNIHADCTTLDCLAGGASSLLLTKPLAGSVAHAGTKPFSSTSDPIYQRWLSWITNGAPLDAIGSGPGAVDMGSPGMDLGSSPADMAPAETVKITFTTSASPSAGSSPYDPKNVVVVWIENAGGTFVKTAGRWANTRRTKLVAWVAKAGTADVDAVSGATQANYGTLTATWDMSARAGGAVPPDGVYTIRLELADSNATAPAQNNQGTFSFNRNGTASTQNGLSNGGFSNVSIVYSGR